jgi:hypothetical protein
MLGLLLLSSLQIHGTNVPENFRTKEFAAYFGCVRAEAKGSPDPDVPRLVAFTQLMNFCRDERESWADALRGLIQTRHPDWTKKRVFEAAELVITGFELQLLVDRQRPKPVAVHDTPEPQF